MTTQHTFSPSLPGAPLTPGPPGKPFKKGENHNQIFSISEKKLVSSLLRSEMYEVLTSLPGWPGSPSLPGFPFKDINMHWNKILQKWRFFVEIKLLPIFKETELCLECSSYDTYLKDTNQVESTQLLKWGFLFEKQGTKTWQVSNKHCVNAAWNDLQLTNSLHLIIPFMLTLEKSFTWKTEHSM